MKRREEQLRALAPLARAELAKRSLLDFWQRVMPNYLFDEPIHAYLADIGEKVLAGEPGYDRICLVVQPGIGKSAMLRGILALALGQKPGLRAAFVSGLEKLATRNSEDTMALVRSDAYPWGPAHLDAEGKTYWRMRNGSTALSIAFDARITGFRFNAMMLDDIQTTDLSPELMDDLELRLRRDIETRLDPGGWLWLTQSCWGDDDIVHRLMRGPDAARWKFISLPAIAGENDVLGRAPGETLSRRWPIEALEIKKLTMGSVAFAAQYQNDPMSSLTAIFQPAGFKNFYDRLPEFKIRVMGVDTAWKLGPQHDQSAIVLVGIGKHDGNIYIIDVWAGQLVYHELKAKVSSFYSKHEPNLVAIEDSASGVGLIQEFKASTQRLMPVRAMKCTDSKEARATALSVHFENNRVFLPRSAPWLSAYVEAFLRFGSSAHDDVCDATELAVRALHGPQGGMWFATLSNTSRAANRNIYGPDGVYQAPTASAKPVDAWGTPDVDRMTRGWVLKGHRLGAMVHVAGTTYVQNYPGRFSDEIKTELEQRGHTFEQVGGPA